MKKAIVFVIIFLFFLSAAANGRHKYHTSLTTIDQNTDEKLLEITIKVFAHDLIPALEKKTRKRIDLETTKDIDLIIEKYLAEKFVLKTGSGETKNIDWVGKEFETDVVYFYIEIPFEGDLEGAELKNTLFFEKFAEQVNLVHINYADKKSDLVFKVGDDFKTIETSEK